MAVAANYMMVEPKHALGLFGGAAFTATWAPLSGLDVSSFDLDNAFTRIETPQWLWPWAAKPPELALDVWGLLPPDMQNTLHPCDPVAPCYRRLAMGMAHSVNSNADCVAPSGDDA